MDEHTEKEGKLVAQFQHFQPRPSQDAYDRMAKMPWGVPSRKKPLMKFEMLSRPIRFALTALILIVIAGTAVWVTPPLRSLAQEVLNSLFNRASNSTIVVEPAADPPEIVEIPPSVAQTFLTLADAEAATGLNIRTPHIGLAPFTLSGITINHETQTLWLIYNAPNRYMSIYQRSTELGWLDDGLVGLDAQIDQVEFESVNGVTLIGEYVAGAWQIDNSQSAQWTTDTSQKRLRWQDEQYAYEMVMFGSNEITAQDMVAIAASMQ